MSTVEPPIVIETRPDCDASVIWLHGLGADGNDFVPLLPELHLSPDLAIRFVFPHAPMRPVTLNGGLVMRAWFDMSLSESGLRESLDDLSASAQSVMGWVDEQRERGIVPGRIVLAGFSQGGLLALYTALRARVQFAGVIALSCWLPEKDGLSPVPYPLPVFVGHGNQDPVIPIRRGDLARQRVTELGAEVEAPRYPMGHAVCAQEIEDISRWLSARLRA